MPLRISIKDNNADNKAEVLQVLKRGDSPAMVPFSKDNQRKLYLFRCDGEKSYVSMSKTAANMAMDLGQVMANGLESVKVLQSGESFELTITTPTGKLTTLILEHTEE